MSDQAATAGPSPVARGRTYLPGKIRAAGALGCCVLVAAGVAWVIGWPRERHEPASSSTGSSGWGMGRALPEQSYSVAARVPEPPATKPSEIPKPVEPVVAPVPAPASAHIMGFWEDAGAAQQAAQQVGARPDAARRGSVDPATGVVTPGAPGAEQSDYAHRMQTTEFGDAIPTPPRFHTQYTIAEGTTFPCTVREPVSSALPGNLQCTTGQDVWSMDGNTILLPRGTEVTGRIERGLANGEERLFVVWTRARTPAPDLLVIPLNSPAADELGQTGAPGDVNTHFWRRFGNALAYSLLDIAASAVGAVANSGRGNTYVNLGSVGSTAQSLGAQEFQRDANIPPTLFRAQGMTMTVYVNHYIDLIHFYQLRPRY